MSASAPLNVTAGPLPALPDLAREWQALEARSDASYFTSWGWVGTWLALLPPAVQSRLVRGAAGDETVGLGVVVERRIRRHGFVASQALFLHTTGDPALDELTVEYNGFLRDRRRPEVATTMTRFLVDEYPGWDEIYMDGLADAGAYIAPVGANLLCRRRTRQVHFVDLDRIRSTGGDYLGSVGSNTRYNIRRSQKEYRKLGPITLDSATSVEQALDYFDRLKTWHQAYWNEKGHAGSFVSAFFESFHRRLIRERFAAGEIQLLRVRAGERVVGYLYNFVYRGRVYNYQSGFDYGVCERYNRPGLVSHLAAIDYSLQQGAHAYDLLAGDNQYKRSLGTQVGELQWVVLQRPQWQFRLEHGLRNVKRWFARRAAPAMGAAVPE
jgi:hypothetical protein